MSMKVVVGLGNPGPRYRGTRHNVGFAVIDYLAQGPGADSFRSRFQAQTAELREGELQMLLVKPETFMNLSGRCVREIVDFYKLPVEDLLIVCDDINLPLGKLRARARGSAGGHNGLRNIQDQLGTADYSRFRIGVDAPMLTHNEATVDHVLSRFKPGEQNVIDEAIEKAAQAVVLWAHKGIDVCMNTINAPEPIRRDPKSQDKQTRKQEDREKEPGDGRSFC
jgi:PTH1 family peptidyl-tRNA hydrolase